MPRFTVSVTDEQNAWIERQADEQDRSKSQIVRRLIDARREGHSGDDGATTDAADGAVNDGESRDEIAAQLEAVLERLDAIEAGLATADGPARNGHGPATADGAGPADPTVAEHRRPDAARTTDGATAAPEHDDAAATPTIGEREGDLIIAPSGEDGADDDGERRPAAASDEPDRAVADTTDEPDDEERAGGEAAGREPGDAGGSGDGTPDREPDGEQPDDGGPEPTATVEEQPGDATSERPTEDGARSTDAARERRATVGGGPADDTAAAESIGRGRAGDAAADRDGGGEQRPGGDHEGATDAETRPKLTPSGGWPTGEPQGLGSTPGGGATGQAEADEQGAQEAAAPDRAGQPNSSASATASRADEAATRSDEESASRAGEVDPSTVQERLEAAVDDRALADSVFVCWNKLRKRGTADERQFKSIFDGQGPYDSVEAWWADVRDHLDELPGVVPPKGNGRFYRYSYKGATAPS